MPLGGGDHHIRLITIASTRKIIHIDMDAFFASVEQRDHPEYRNKPLIVGGDPGKRGVVAACSYEARKFGIHSAMPSSRAQRLCPDAIFVKPKIDAYREVSDQLRAIFDQYSDLVEPLSLDEAYLDVSNSDQFQGSATLIAKDIKRSIFEKTDLIASAGVSYNKFLAKIASDQDKPNGLFLITPEEGEEFVRQLKVGKFYGVGKVTEAKMKSLGIHNGKDLKKWSEENLTEQFGKIGKHYYLIARGIDHRKVEPSRIRKSLGSELTYDQDLDNPTQIKEELKKFIRKVNQSLSDKKLLARTFTIKIKYDNFEQITRSQTLESPLTAEKMLSLIPLLIEKTEIETRKVRLLGISVSKLENQQDQESNLPKQEILSYQKNLDLQQK